jgi:hypothetical protein
MKDGAPPNTVAGFKTAGLKPPGKGIYQRFVAAVCDGELLGVKVSLAKSGWTHLCRRPTASALFHKRESEDNRQVPGGPGSSR